MRLRLFALAYNLANFLRSLALPREAGFTQEIASVAQPAWQGRVPIRKRGLLRALARMRGFEASHPVQLLVSHA